MSDSINPLSSKFQLTAAKNIQRFVGGLKKQEDIQKSEQGKTPVDIVKIKSKSIPKSKVTRAPEEASRSGILSEQEEIRKKEKEITKDVPPETLKAARKIVKSKINEMQDLVPIPENLMVNLELEDYFGIMEIHDWTNEPIFEEKDDKEGG
ncbi:MAG: hypothetical protein J7M18_05570 [Candidatus Eremiobacteraeota bacterium]|nr:hypothetical protein [Candidatus Eremiobacteraeota bacterium]